MYKQLYYIFRTLSRPYPLEIHRNLPGRLPSLAATLTTFFAQRLGMPIRVDNNVFMGFSGGV
jgi:hypothetical protein